MNLDFWRGKRVFVTGHTGFKGSWLSLCLQEAGAVVTGYSLLPPTNPSLFEVADVTSGMTSIIGDIRDFSSVLAAVREHRPDVLFHLAAQSLVRHSYSNPRDTYETNVMGTVNVLEALRQAGGVRAVVIVTSDKCYENREWVWPYRENEPMGGHDPYSSSKGCAELVSAAFRNSYFKQADFSKHGTALATARAGNVIGGGDWAADRLVPDIVRALLAGQSVQIRNPGAIRPWQHVMEPLSGYLLLAQKLYDSGPLHADAWNFGPAEDETIPVSWIVARLVELWGHGASWHADDENHPHEATLLKLDSSKARGLLGWHPKLRLDETIEWLVDWYKSNAAGYPMRDITLGQIRSYAAK